MHTKVLSLCACSRQGGEGQTLVRVCHVQYAIHGMMLTDRLVTLRAQIKAIEDGSAVFFT